MSKLRKRFWVYGILFCLFASLGWFFGYSLFNWDKMYSMENMELLHNGLLPWYHPAAFWARSFADWFIETTGKSDPGAVAQAIMGTIQIGLGSCLSLSEGLFVLNGYEIYRKFRKSKTIYAMTSERMKRPWFVTLYALMITTVFIGILFFFGDMLYQMKAHRSAGMFLILTMLFNMLIWPLLFVWWIWLKKFHWFIGSNKLPLE